MRRATASAIRQRSVKRRPTSRRREPRPRPPRPRNNLQHPNHKPHPDPRLRQASGLPKSVTQRVRQWLAPVFDFSVIGQSLANTSKPAVRRRPSVSTSKLLFYISTASGARPTFRDVDAVEKPVEHGGARRRGCPERASSSGLTDPGPSRLRPASRDCSATLHLPCYFVASG